MIAIDTFVEHHTVDGEATISHTELHEMWREWLGAESLAEDSGWETFADVVASALDQRLGTELRFGGAWEIRARSALVRTALSTGLVAAALAVVGATGLPSLVLPAVLPLLFDVDYVELTKSDEYILAHLRLHENIREEATTPEEIYAALPEDVRTQMSQADLADFIERCRKAGVADVNNDTVLLRDPARPKFRVTFT